MSPGHSGSGRLLDWLVLNAGYPIVVTARMSAPAKAANVGEFTTSAFVAVVHVEEATDGHSHEVTRWSRRLSAEKPQDSW